jgi:predicted AAA+ superfamily ATPase
MPALFVELPPFERYRAEYLDDEAFHSSATQKKALKRLLDAELEARTKS